MFASSLSKILMFSVVLHISRMCCSLHPCVPCRLPLLGDLGAPPPIKGWIFLTSWIWSVLLFALSSRMGGSHGYFQALLSLFLQAVLSMLMSSDHRRETCWTEDSHPVDAIFPQTAGSNAKMQHNRLSTPAGPSSNYHPTELWAKMTKLQTQHPYCENSKLSGVLHLSCWGCPSSKTNTSI